MSKLRFALVILVLHFFFHSIQAQPGETKTGTATVSGRVTLKGEPARGVVVILTPEIRWSANAPRARTDENGRFSFTSFAAGTVWIFAVAPGYVSPEKTCISSPGKRLSVADGARIENVDLEIRRGGVIAGRITDSQGRPVIEEGVALIKLDRNNKPQDFHFFSPDYNMSRTDDRGVYRIYGLPEGRYLVSAGHGRVYWLIARAAPDDEPIDGSPAPAAWDANERAKLRKVAEAMKIEIELKPCQRIMGQIVKQY